MKRLIVLFLFSFSVLSAANVSDFQLKNLDNKLKSYSELRGEKLTLVDFWATWCKPCIQAIPKLNKLYSQYKEKGVELIGINVDSPRNSAKVKPFARAHKISYPVLRDPNSEVASELNVTVFPTLYIVNNKNEIVYSHIGFRPGDEAIVMAEIDKLLEK